MIACNDWRHRGLLGGSTGGAILLIVLFITISVNVSSTRAREGGRGFGQHRTSSSAATSSHITTRTGGIVQPSANKLFGTNATLALFPTPQSAAAAASSSGLPLAINKDAKFTTLPMSLQPQEGDDKYLYDWEALLLKKLFSKTSYNNDVRPAKSNMEPVHVTLELVLLQINDLIDKEQQIVISGFLKINWDDERLAWNPEQFGDIEWIVTSARNVWLPDIALINSDDVYAVTRDGRFPVTITSNGQILYVPAGKIHARCELDLRFFPFDDQLCTYRFESWVYAAELVQINGINFTIDRNHYVDNHQWEIRDSFVHTRIVNYEMYNFSRVEFFMLLRRKSLFFITYTIFPCLALSTLQIFSHMLPFTESERINFATTTLIAFSVFHVSIVEQMPQSSHAIPLLAIYIDALMCLIGLSLLECFLMMNWLSKVGCSVPSPRMWYYVVDRWGDYMLLGSNGTYWRRNYLRILEEVNAKEAADTRRKAYERKKWSATSRKHQESYIRKWSNFGAQTRKNSEIEALICLMNRWGYSFGNLNHIRRRPNQGGVIPDVPGNEHISNKHRTKHSFRHVDELDKYGSIATAHLSNVNLTGYIEQTAPQRSPKHHHHETELGPDTPPARQRMLTPDGGGSSSRDSSRHSSKRRSRRSKKETSSSAAHIAHSIEQLNVDIETVGTSPKNHHSPSSALKHIDDTSPRDETTTTTKDAAQKIRRGRFQRTSTIDKTGSVVNFNADTQQYETRLSAGGSVVRRLERNRSESVHQQQPIASSSLAAVNQTDKQMQLTALDDIRQLIDDVNSSLSSHTLRRECIGVWTTFITVIDRIMSLILMLLCILMPTYLFVIFPKPMDLTNLKSSQNAN